MNNIRDMCFLCIKDQNCVSVDYKIVSQVEYLIPEITIFNLGIPLRICSVCYDALYAFSKFKLFCIESSQRFEQTVKAEAPPLNTDGAQVASTETTTKNKQQNASPTGQQMAQTSLQTDGISPEQIFIKEEKIEETLPEQNILKPECTKNNSEGPSPVKKIKKSNEKSQESPRDPLSQTDIEPSSNSQNLEEIYIKEEHIEDSPHDTEYFNSILKNSPQKEYSINNSITNDVDDSMQADETNDWEGSSANCEDETVKTTDSTKLTSLNSLPEISKKKYELAYKLFMDWRKTQKISSYAENVLLAYFAKISKQYKASTLWTQYSMLRTTLNINDKVDIANYSKLRAFLKRESCGYKPKKSKTFNSNEIYQFIKEAPDREYLLTKVAFIMGIMGACRRTELYQMKTTDFNDSGSSVVVAIPDNKAKNKRKFTITGQFYQFFKKYANLRPSHCRDPSFFINYQKGKCTIQKVGINKFGAMGKQIAKYLNLPNPELYTGHCFRRSSATILVDTVDTFAENYCNSSIKTEIPNENRPSTSTTYILGNL